METQQIVQVQSTASKPQDDKQPKRVLVNQIPEEILNDELLNQAIKVLPQNYTFEIHKTVWRIREIQKTKPDTKLKVCLQLPEGFLMYGTLIADILEHFTNSECFIMCDVTYGACCIDDISAHLLGSDLLVHYGHSCLVPIDQTSIKTLYVFVEIMIDIEHLYKTLLLNFPDPNTPLTIMGTIQFNTSLFQLKTKLNEAGFVNVMIPQEKPRSAGEVLGCTAPSLELRSLGNVVVFVCDGRFHMEAAMIANPEYIFYQYNPYSKKMTIEKYNITKMMSNRKREIERAKSTELRSVGIILGVLGRQGSPHILQKIETVLKNKGIRHFTLLISEIYLTQLNLLADQVDVWVQIACPRISIDWGLYFNKPLLTPYELLVAVEDTDWKEVYPMDFYSDKGGEWSNYNYKKSQAKKRDANKPKVDIGYEKTAAQQ